MASAAIRVFLVDDRAGARSDVRLAVDDQDDLTVVGEAGDGDEAVQRLRVTPADVVLMNVRMPRLDGVQATRRMAAMSEAPQVIVLTTFDLDAYAFEAIRAGAAAFLPKDAGPPAVLRAIRTVHAGDALVAPAETRRLLEHFAQTSARVLPEHDPRLASLSEDDRGLLRHVGRGHSNEEIARALVVDVTTVRAGVGDLLATTGCRDRVHLVVLAHETGLVG